MTEDGGVVKKVIKEGSGDFPKNGYTIHGLFLYGIWFVAHYTGTLENGKKFDSSRDRNEVFKFPLGQGQVIRAWDIGFASMRVGEHAVLVCKPEYAYGSSGAGENIPPNSTLLFDVELIDYEEKISVRGMTFRQRIDAVHYSWSFLP